MAVTLLVGVLLPLAVGWRVERSAKARYLRARGRQLQVRSAPLERAGAWLAARGLRPTWGAAAAAPAALVAAPLLLWQLSDMTVALAGDALCQRRP